MGNSQSEDIDTITITRRGKSSEERDKRFSSPPDLNNKPPPSPTSAPRPRPQSTNSSLLTRSSSKSLKLVATATALASTATTPAPPASTSASTPSATQESTQLNAPAATSTDSLIKVAGHHENKVGEEGISPMRRDSHDKKPSWSQPTSNDLVNAPLKRTRGYSQLQFSPFATIAEQDEPSSMLSIDKKKKAELSKEAKDKIESLMRSRSGSKGNNPNGTHIGLTNKSGGELEWRPRSNSEADFNRNGTHHDAAKVRRASISIAAIKRASLRIEQCIKAKLVQQKKVPVLSKEERAAIKIQSTFRRWVAVKRYKRHVQRASVAREVLITELDYVRFLSVLVKVYYYPLRKAKILTPEEINAIFPQIEIIKIYNTKFVESLQNKMREWSCYQTIGDAFLAMVDLMREPYAIYISQFPDISERIKICSQRPPVAQFLMKCTKFTEVASMDLLSLVSMPFQRIPRYILLLKECLKYTDKTHKDYELIRIAVKKLDSLTQAASERLRMEEGSKSVLRVSALLDPPVANLVRPYRKLIRDSTIDAKIVPPKAKEKDFAMEKNCILFLFTDCVLLAKAYKKSFFDSNSSQKLRPIGIMDLRGAEILDVVQPSNEFRLRVQAGIVILQTKNWPEKEAWRSDIIDTIHSLADLDLSVPRTPVDLSRSASVSLASPAGAPISLTRTRSQIAPQSAASQKKKPPPKRLTRQFTLPQITELFGTQKFAAPKEEASATRIGSYNSFLKKKETTNPMNTAALRKRKRLSLPLPTRPLTNFTQM